tara:strand:+ start:1773 stop:2441 length:669 start_codon:yes stop_codon:yes gene_type:complete
MRNCTEVYKELKSHGHKFDVIYDIGANVGDWTRKWKLNEPNSTFVMFEANKDINPKVSPNDIYLHEILSDEDGKEVKYYQQNGNVNAPTGNSYFKEQTKHFDRNTFTILQTRTLDSLRKEKELPLPDMIKLDTQGSEVDILNGADKSLSQCKLILTEAPVMQYNEGAPSFNQYMDKFRDMGFLPSGIEKLAIKKGVFLQIDVVFVREDILESIHKFKSTFKI